MKFLKQFENWNPALNKEVKDFIDQNKTNLIHLWNKDKSEEENMEFLTNYFTENPQLMDDKIDFKNITSISPQSGIKNIAPKLMNIGGVKDFRSF
jgi:hypothetical protein